MAIIVLIVLGVVAFATAYGAIVSVGPFLAVRRFHRALVTPVGSLVKGAAVTVRGTIVEARRPSPYPRLTPGDVVFSRLTVTEQVGKQTNIAFQAKAAQVFTLSDDAGNSIDVDPRMAEVADAHAMAEKDSKVPAEFKNYINRQGSWRWPNTPAMCREESLKVGDVVTLRGQVVLPLPGEIKDGDSELRVAAKQMSLYESNPWRGQNGRALLYSLAAFVAASAGSLGCMAWAGWL